MNIQRAVLATAMSTVIALPTAANEELRAQIATGAAAVEQKVIGWRRDIHAHPELGNRETRTAALVAKHLKALKLEVTTGVAHTGVIGLLRGGRPGPVVALRADMDALPVTEPDGLPFASKVRTTFNDQETGVMHACGHDAHVAMLMGAAEVLAGMREELPGTIKFIFQPAEEGAPKGEEGGAELMLKEGVLEGDLKPEVSTCTIVPTAGRTHPDFTQWSAAAAKEWFLPKFQKLRGGVDYLAGSDLDRFSRYQFSFFGADRLNGYSGTGVRFDEGLIGRLGYTFNVLEAVRFDAALETAQVQRDDDPVGRQTFTGIGFAANVVGPWKTVINLNYGRALAADIPDLEGEQEFLLLVFKLF